MFFGKVITHQAPFAFTPESAEEGREVLSLTNVTLAPSSKDGAQLFIKKGTEKFLIALLTKERPQATINVYLTLEDNVQLLVEGNGTIHATGYYEPEGNDDLPFDDLEEEDFDGESDEEEEEDSEVEEEKAVAPAPAKTAPVNSPKAQPQAPSKSPAQKPKSPAQKPVAAPESDEDEDLEDEEDLEDLEDLEDEDLDGEDLEEDEDEEEDDD